MLSMRILIASMPLLALVMVLATTAQRVPDQQPSLRESILPETLELVRTMKGFKKTIADDIDRTEGRPVSLTTSRRLPSKLVWSAGDWAE